MSATNTRCEPSLRLPRWFKQPLPDTQRIGRLKGLLRENNLHTVCESARCPNLGTCWARGTATFMILGNTCSRSCRFCAVPAGPAAPVDEDEPRRIAATVRALGIRHAVITSVTRDDLPDGGARQFVRTVAAIREVCPETAVELLIPDFRGRQESLRDVLQSSPEVLGHNIETVRRIFSLVRPQAEYDRSLDILQSARRKTIGSKIKSGLMIGMGETRAELMETMKDLARAGCEILTIGQYLSPGKAPRLFPVDRFVSPEEFSDLRILALQYGFKSVQSGPLVRSSFMAEDVYLRCPSSGLSPEKRRSLKTQERTSLNGRD